MSNQNADLVRAAYDALARGDLETMLTYADEDLDWTYLDPNDADAAPQVCHGRHRLEDTLRHWAEHGFTASLEEIEGHGERVMVCVRVRGVDDHYGRAPGTIAPTTCSPYATGGSSPLRDCRNRG